MKTYNALVNILMFEMMKMLSWVMFAVGPDHILAERHFVILVSTIAFTLPLSLYRNIEKLGKVRLIMIQYSCQCHVVFQNIHPCLQVSFLSMVLTFIILIVAVIRAPTLGPQMYK